MTQRFNLKKKKDKSLKLTDIRNLMFFFVEQKAV